MTYVGRVILAVLPTITLLGCGSSVYISSTSATSVHSTSAHSISKVVVVVFENADYSDAMNQPFFKQMAQQGASFSNFYAEAHPSQPNYIAMTSGDTYGVINDSNVDVDARNIVDLLEAAGKTWKVYAEDWPGNCFQGSRSGNYARKHVPFISYKNIQSTPARCGRIVNASQFQADTASNSLPDYSYYVPNMQNDGHDTSASFASNWLKNTFGSLLTTPNFSRDVTLFLTFDESSFAGGNKIYTVMWGKGVRAGSTSTQRYDHYSMLRTIEDGLAIGNLGRKDATALSFDGVWQVN